MLSSLGKVINLLVPSWPVPKVIEADVAFMSAATRGVLLVASEARHSSRLVAPLANARVHRRPNICGTQVQMALTARKSPSN